MARKKDVSQTAKGLYVRNLGWRRTATGYAQQKFYLGRDEAQAQLASLRLTQLWQQVGRRWEREHGDLRRRQAPVLNRASSGVAGTAEVDRTNGILSINQIGLDESVLRADVGDRPVWDEVTLAIAEAVRKGEAVVQLPIPMPFSAMLPESSLLGDWLHQLQGDFTVIKIELHDEESRTYTDQFSQREGHRLIDMGRKMLHRKAGGETLYAALDGYKTWIETRFVTTDKRLTSWGKIQVRHVTFVRKHVPNCDLDDLGAHQVEELIDILRLRPARVDGKPISVDWARNCIKQLRQFFRWLNRSVEFGWKRPADLELGRVQIPTTSQEKSAAARSAQVETYTLEELRTCWEYALPFQRLIMLLSLNCGFGRAEVASLEIEDLLLRQRHPCESEIGITSTPADSWIRRTRHKTGVYGEWKLWPDTTAALDWWFRQRALIDVPSVVSTVLVTRTGHRYDAPTKGNNANDQLSSSWFRLTEQIRNDHPEFRRLSYNKLRKTAGNLIRKEADGETAGIFLAHGTPVKADELLDLYTNRPFGRVFMAIDRVGEKLRPLWDGVAVPFPEVRKKSGAKLSQGKIRRIAAMRQQGYKVNFVAKKLRVSAETVRRWGEPSEPQGQTSSRGLSADSPS